MKSKEIDAKKKAKEQWDAAQSVIVSHQLVSDVELEVSLLKSAAGFEKWGRGLFMLMASLVLPKVPAFFLKEEVRQVDNLIFLILGLVCLIFALVYLYKDTKSWYRWWRARKSIKNKFYDYPYLAPLSGHRNEDDLRVIERNDIRWTEIKKWIQDEKMKTMMDIWNRWNESHKPLRYMDVEIMRDAVLAFKNYRVYFRK